MPKRGFSGPQIESTWNRVMGASEQEFARLERRSGPFQEELTGFVMGFTISMRPDVSAMALEIMVCAYEVYREHAVSVRSASEEAVQAQWERSKREMEELEVLVDAGEGFDSMVFGHAQPALMSTVLGILLDVDPEDEEGLSPEREQDGPELSENEFWHLLTVMHTVLGVLETHAEHRVAA